MKVHISVKFIVLACAAVIVLGVGADIGLAANIADNETGGDCTAIGAWDQYNRTCELNTDVTGQINIISNNITLDGNGHSLTGSDAYGVYVESYSGATIKNLHIDGFAYGIFLAFSGSNHILSNTITNASEEGIGIWGSFGSEVAWNDISYSGWDGIGVVLSSAGITIHDNVIHDNTWGIWFAGSGAGNRVYNNNFLNNTYQVDGSDADPVTLYLDEWRGGNFWSDLTGPDANGDGVVDVPYVTIVGTDNRAWTQQDGWISGDTNAPVVDSVLPAGTVPTDSAVIGVYYTDSQSGINTSSVSVTLDGSALSGCAVSTTSASCTAYGLAAGAHTIGGSVSDVSGNTAPISGGFTVAGSPPPPPPSGQSWPHGTYGTGNAPAANQTDLCLSCHDVHNAAGDYVLMRESTVTDVCGTCHSLYGEVLPSSPTWTEPPCGTGVGETSSGCTADLENPDTLPEAGVSPSAAYKNSSPASGHRLGLGTNEIPASDTTLKVIRSEDYEEGEIYDHNAASSLSATNGLYCASCHTPHGSITGRDFPACADGAVTGPGCDADTDKDIPTPTGVYNSSGVLTGEFFSGDQLVADDSGAEHPHRAYPQWLISSNPNHLSARGQTGEADGDADGVYCEATDGFTAANDTIIPNGLCDKMMAPVDPVDSRDEFCVRCHNLQWSAESVFTDKGLLAMGEGVSEGEGHSLSPNHPPLCMSCHGPANAYNTGTNDFPHTSENYKILAKDHDGLCLGCHSNGRLP